MDNTEMRFLLEAFSIGLKSEVLELLPFKPLHVTPFYDEGFILESTNGKKFLQIYQGSEDALIGQIQLLQCFQQQGLNEFLYPITLSNERTYAKYDEQCWFYITPWPSMGKVYFSRIDHLRAMVNLLANFRRTISESSFSFYLPVCRPNNLLEKYQEIIKQIQSFELLAKFRLHSTSFDRLFLSHLPEIVKQTDDALGILAQTDYYRMVAKISPKAIIINKLTRHNLRINSDGVGICLSLDSIQCDLPIIDLAILLIKSGRSNQWALSWFEDLLKEYQTYFKINETEFQIILAYLTFPWSLYRLIARYYYNRVEWPLRTFTEKMQRLLDDEPERIQLLEKLVHWNLE